MKIKHRLLAGALCTLFASTAIAQTPASCAAAASEKSYKGSLSNYKLLTLEKDEWLFRTMFDLTTKFEADALSLNQLKRLVTALNARGTQLMIVYVPTRGLLHSDKLQGATAASYDVAAAKDNYIKTLENFRAQGAIVANFDALLTPENANNFYYKRDHHWKASGAKVTADLVSAYLKKQAIYSTLPKRSFSSKEDGTANSENGSLQVGWRSLCNQQFSPEVIQKYSNAANKEQGTSNANALLADEKMPAIVLAGTSFSAKEDLNFMGFMRDNLGVDIRNESVTGGGPDTAMLQYLSSDDYKKQPAKLLIWELPSYSSINGRAFFRQAIPLTSMGCNGKKPILEEDVKLQAGSNALLVNPIDANTKKMANIVNKDHIIELAFSSPEIKNFELTILQDDGKVDSLKLKRTEKTGSANNYVVELRSDEKWGDLIYQSMTLNLPSDLKDATVKAKVCRK